MVRSRLHTLQHSRLAFRLVKVSLLTGGFGMHSRWVLETFWLLVLGQATEKIRISVTSTGLWSKVCVPLTMTVPALEDIQRTPKPLLVVAVRAVRTLARSRFGL